jgi:mannose-6-phosphate isomerase class I
MQVPPIRHPFYFEFCLAVIKQIIKYAPPVEEFAVDRIQFVDPPQAFQLEPYAGPSILLCIEGCALTNLEPGGFVVKRGTILFIPYNATFTLAPSAPDFVAFRVYCVLGSGEEQANESNGKQQM